MPALFPFLFLVCLDALDCSVGSKTARPRLTESCHIFIELAIPVVGLGGPILLLKTDIRKKTFLDQMNF
jgi:hypothetical protein